MGPQTLRVLLLHQCHWLYCLEAMGSDVPPWTHGLLDVLGGPIWKEHDELGRIVRCRASGLGRATSSVYVPWVTQTPGVA